MKTFFENHQICKECGGKCCKQSGCNYHPKDFKEMTFDYLKPILDKGEISISVCVFVNADDNNKLTTELVLNLRSRNINRPIVDLISKLTTCAQLTDSGCKYSFDERPTGGTLLIPDKNNCINLFPKEIQIMEWKKYQKVLKALVRYYSGKSFENEFKLQVEKISHEMNIEAIQHLEKKITLSYESLEMMQTLRLIKSVLF